MVGYETNKPKGNCCAEIGQDLKDINKINSLKSENSKDNSLVPRYTKDNSPPGDHVTFEGLDDVDSIFSEKSNEKLPPIPDGGWGWMVVFAAFLIAACADGLAYSFGILHEEFTNYFEQSQSKTSLVGSLFISTPLISGPIMSALVDRYGCRTMTIIAAIVSTIGFLLAAVSNTVEMLCLTLGFLGGSAMGIFYVTAVVPVAFWFDKKRTLAVSIASCGVGVGTLIYSPLTDFILQYYDWRNTLVLLAGTVLNVCVCGALMRDPDWMIIKEMREKKETKARSMKSSSAGSISLKSTGGDSMYLSADEINALLRSGKSPEYILATLTTSLVEAKQLEATTQMNIEQSCKRAHSVVQVPTFIQKGEVVPAEVIDKLMSNKRLYNIILQNYPDLLIRRHSETNLNVEPSIINALTEPKKMNLTLMAKKLKKATDAEQTKTVKKEEVKETPNNEVTNNVVAVDTTYFKEREQKPVPNPIKSIEQPSWLSRQINIDHQYLRDMTLYKNTIMYRGAMLNIPRYKLRASSLPDIYKNSTWSLLSGSDDNKKWYKKILDGFKSTFDFKMFTEFHFLIFNLATLILAVWAIIPYFFLKSYMTAMNMEGGATMISIIGIASGIGIVGLGWFGDQPWFNVTKAYAVCLIICGISIGAYPLFIKNYWAVAIISTVFGVSYASSYSYTPAILIKLVPIDYFTLGYGLILLSQGIGHLIGPPLGGLLFDVTKTWDLTFYIGGVWLIFGGVCVGIIPYTRNMRLCGSAPLLNDVEEAQSKKSVVV
ncbi:unnamed protein product [Euphydryas editha]|uniref:Major facilitator superfamily (MFS) profile domain-containing protein n=1 Tax=Euphydryas editha TaxID=104508 RepID=A0AAU9TJI4_EUPED|nr:unnamed protein product [Euphydryas editha]